MRSKLGAEKQSKWSLGTFQRIYQYKDGSYLPDSSQPDEKMDYAIVSKTYSPHISTRYINVDKGTDKGKALPELYEKRENCCGCTACYAICPVGAIAMRPDEEGFLYPVVDAMKCIRCYKCLSVCAFKEAQKEKGYLK